MHWSRFNDYSVGIAEARNGLAGERKSYTAENVRSLVRMALLSYGLGQANADAPLVDLIKSGSTVLLKPNWVLHFNHSQQTMDCMVTHPLFIEAILDEVLLAKPGKIIIGDAPIQLCQFEKLVPYAWRRSMQEHTNIPIEFLDFRRHRALGHELADGVELEARPIDRYRLFDLGCDSLLEPISEPAGRFRVTNYDPIALARTHLPGRHQYLLSREAFEADLIISLPKLKTHRKTGITGALKNLVGLNGNKDYLPHHRVGGAVLGGDCYPGLAPLKRFAEFCLDQANKKINTPAYEKWHSRAFKVLARHRPFGDEDIEGSWYGNDTTWRMVLDLNRILMYGRADGTLADTVQRRIYSLTDAIVVGQGEGPLAPEPLWMGMVTFTGSSPFADLVHAALLGMDYQRLPLVRESFGSFRYPLTLAGPEQCVIRTREEKFNLREVQRLFGLTANIPRGWIGHV